jgi:uncharacterized membrane protein
MKLYATIPHVSWRSRTVLFYLNEKFLLSFILVIFVNILGGLKINELQKEREKQISSVICYRAMFLC